MKLDCFLLESVGLKILVVVWIMGIGGSLIFFYEFFVYSSEGFYMCIIC